MSGNRGNAIVRLGEANYISWSADMVDVLLGEGLWFLVDGEDAVGPGEYGSLEKKTIWRDRCAKAMSMMRLAMEDRVRGRYSDPKYCVDPMASVCFGEGWGEDFAPRTAPHAGLGREI